MLKRVYGITIEDFDRILHDQNGKCAICGGGTERTANGSLCVDHDHKTHKIRGLLCDPCNRAIGLLSDCPKRARALADYLEKS